MPSINLKNYKRVLDMEKKSNKSIPPDIIEEEKKRLLKIEQQLVAEINAVKGALIQLDRLVNISSAKPEEKTDLPREQKK